MANPTTLAQLKAAIIKLGGDHCYVNVDLSQHVNVDPGRRYESERWGVYLVVRDGDVNPCATDDSNVIAEIHAHGDSATDVFLKTRAALKDALTERARRRKLTHQQPAKALAAPLLFLEYKP